MNPAPATKRLFYRDPLAAAWMAKHFGMRFTYEADGWPVLLAEIIWTGDGNKLCSEENDNTPERFYVHPDSLPLLEPKSGDVVKLRRWGVVHYGHVSSREGNGVWINDSFWNADDVEILTRMQVRFHWPECEA